MKLLSIVNKNFKVLLKNKTSTLVLLFGPLMIILLIGLAFNNIGSEYILDIGVYSKAFTNASDTLVNSLDEKYNIIEFTDNESCISSVQKGRSNICIIFPEYLYLDDDIQDQILFYVDESRINLVDTVVTKISEIIGMNSETTSKDLTTSLLNTISLTKTEVEGNLLKSVSIKQKTESLVSDVNKISSDASGMDISMDNIDISSIESDIDSFHDDAKSIKNKGIEAIDDAIEFINGLTNVTNSPVSSLTSLKNRINSLDSDLNESYDDIIDAIDDATEDIDNMETKLSTASTKKSNIISKLSSVKTNLNDVKSDITSLKTSLEKITSSISSIKVFSADNIVNPITTIIKPISSTRHQSLYLLPYLIILITMFIGIMLSGTMIIIDKLSSASFRTFTAPTKDSVYLLSYYITNMIILFIQLLIICGLILYLLKIPILINVELSLLILFLSCSLFILIGIAFGYLFKSQEGVTIGSLSFASILLFISNLIIPLERTPIFVQNISKYNPFIILSEMLKKSLIFNIEIIDIISELFLIIIYILGIFVLILIIQKLSKIIYFKKTPHVKRDRLENLTPEHYFRLMDGNVLKNKDDLLKYLQSITNEEFTQFVDHEINPFVIWLKNILRERKLAKQLKDVNKKENMIRILEDNIARGSNHKFF